MNRAAAAVDPSRRFEEDRSRVEKALGRTFDQVAPQLPSGALAILRYAVLAEGKRIRPLLCLAAYRACGGPPAPAAFDLAASIELIHGYSLMHDDLPCMDDAKLRRGRAAVHAVFGEKEAMAAAPLLIPLAMLSLLGASRALGCSGGVRRRLVRDLSEAAGAAGMVGGQALDLLGEERELGSEALDDLHRRKTGALLAAAPVIGARAAGAGEEECGALATYGRALGLAFQIADDLLDATSSAGVLGKEPSDRQLRKSTYPSLHGLEEARRRGWKEVGGARAALEASGVDSSFLAALAEYVMLRER